MRPLFFPCYLRSALYRLCIRTFLQNRLLERYIIWIRLQENLKNSAVNTKERHARLFLRTVCLMGLLSWSACGGQWCFTAIIPPFYYADRMINRQRLRMNNRGKRDESKEREGECEKRESLSISLPHMGDNKNQMPGSQTWLPKPSTVFYFNKNSENW